MRRNIFKANPEKAASRVTINSFMIGSLFFVFTLIWTLNPHKFSQLVIFQLVLAIPMLFVSSLAYAKVGYRKEIEHWDMLGWYTNNIGNTFVLNVVGLLVATEYPWIAYVYFLSILALMLMYSIINVVINPETLGEKIFKYLFFVFFIFALGIFPLLL